jgi:hypothetical protein
VHDALVEEPPSPMISEVRTTTAAAWRSRTAVSAAAFAAP